MIKKRDILVFSDDWGRYPSTLQHIVKQFLPHNRIFWVGSLGLRKPKFSLKDLKRVYEKVVSLFVKGYQKEQETNLYLIKPFIIPYHDIKLFRKINAFLLRRKIKKELKDNSAENIIIFSSSMMIADIYKSLNPTIGVYFCLDDYSLFEGAFNCILDYETKLLEMVDVSFATSEKLRSTRIPANGKSLLMSQGIDENLFKKSNCSRPAELEKIENPIIGFFGLFSEWVDLELISEAAKTYAEYSFVLIGPKTVSLGIFNEQKNIYYLGPKPITDLQGYANHFSIGLIPFKINDLTIAVNPLKLFEYFAFGMPVVSTNMPEVAKYEGLAYIGETTADFVKKIKVAVEENKNDLINQRINLANNNSWKYKAEQVCSIIKE
jgi:glycosyltransferase involved in cell wall biosynthesis